jgi:hypothetical protein
MPEKNKGFCGVFGSFLARFRFGDGALPSVKKAPVLSGAFYQSANLRCF